MQENRTPKTKHLPFKLTGTSIVKPLITATISICFLFQTGQGVANGQQLLAVDNSQLLSIDPSNGASSPIGSVVSSGTFGALAFRSDGELFGGRGFELFSINPDMAKAHWSETAQLVR